MVESMSTVSQISPAVQAALAAGRPVVALESTIISHGRERGLDGGRYLGDR
jgi:pseudouridine-5'-phosphate glycosidase